MKLVQVIVDPDPNAPRELEKLPNYWDDRRRREGKIDTSRCGADLRQALEHQTKAWATITQRVAYGVAAASGAAAVAMFIAPSYALIAWTVVIWAMYVSESLQHMATRKRLNRLSDDLQGRITTTQLDADRMSAALIKLEQRGSL